MFLSSPNRPDRLWGPQCLLLGRYLSSGAHNASSSEGNRALGPIMPPSRKVPGLWGPQCLLLGRNLGSGAQNSSSSEGTWALGPTIPHPRKVPGLSSGVKLSQRKVSHSSPLTTEVKDGWSYTSTGPVNIYGVTRTI